MTRIDPNKLNGSFPSPLGDKFRIIVIGVVLGAIALMYLIPTAETKTEEEVVVRPPPVDVSYYQPDPKILAQVKDTTAIERGHPPQVNVLFHLLKKTYNIGPSASDALGITKEPVNLEPFKNKPEDHRGEYLWVKGQLEEFSEEKLHPIPRAHSYKGRLRTAGGDLVVFWVSQPLPEDVQKDKDDGKRPWVRIEGFFLRVVDEYYLESKVVGAPLLVGPRIDAAYPDWDPVEKLDPKIIDPQANSIFVDGEWRSHAGFADFLVDSESEPLWHMASHAIHEAGKNEESELRHSLIFELKEQFEQLKTGAFERGTACRIRGTFVKARIFRAKLNPVGIEHWSSVWLRIPRLGSKLIPVWIPEDIGEWEFGDSVDVDAFYFKNRAYKTYQGDVLYTPQFVAAHLQKFVIERNPANFWIGIAFAALIGMLALLFFRMNRETQRESANYKKKLVERRRQRRGKPMLTPAPETLPATAPAPEET